MNLSILLQWRHPDANFASVLCTPSDAGQFIREMLAILAVSVFQTSRKFAGLQQGGFALAPFDVIHQCPGN
jgi:hypothetical protein